MKLLVGLGNPGQKYQQTRHNVGFRFVDHIASMAGVKLASSPRFRADMADARIGDERVLLVQPQTFMNNSGEAVAPLCRYYQLATDDVFIVFDDLDLPAGKVRLRHGGGHGGHNGLRSLHQHLPDTDYYRLKIGIGRPDHGNITGWVLGQGSEDERAAEAIAFKALTQQLPLILRGDIAKAANAIHLAIQ